MLAHSLHALQREIDAVRPNAYAIFGSTALALRGIIDREPDDIDVMVSRELWGALLPRKGWRVETPNAGDPPILTFDTPNPLHLFFDWSDELVKIDPITLIATAEKHGDFWLATVEEVVRHKEAAYGYVEHNPAVAKHLPDIVACWKWLRGER